MRGASFPFSDFCLSLLVTWSPEFKEDWNTGRSREINLQDSVQNPPSILAAALYAHQWESVRLFPRTQTSTTIIILGLGSLFGNICKFPMATSLSQLYLRSATLAILQCQSLLAIFRHSQSQDELLWKAGYLLLFLFEIITILTAKWFHR